MALNARQNDALLDFYEQCCAVTAAYQQLETATRAKAQAAARQGVQAAYDRALEVLSVLMGGAVDRGVPLQRLQQVALKYLPSEVIQLVLK